MGMTVETTPALWSVMASTLLAAQREENAHIRWSRRIDPFPIEDLSPFQGEASWGFWFSEYGYSVPQTYPSEESAGYPVDFVARGWCEDLFLEVLREQHDYADYDPDPYEEP